MWPHLQVCAGFGETVGDQQYCSLLHKECITTVEGEGGALCGVLGGGICRGAHEASVAVSMQHCSSVCVCLPMTAIVPAMHQGCGSHLPRGAVDTSWHRLSLLLNLCNAP